MCDRYISSSARGTSLAVEHRCHSFQAWSWGRPGSAVLLPPSPPPVGRLMIRAESSARKTPAAGRHGTVARDLGTDVVNPRTLRSVPGIWGRSLTSIPQAGRQAAVRTIPTTTRSRQCRVFSDRLALGIVVAGTEEDPKCFPLARHAPVVGRCVRARALEVRMLCRPDGHAAQGSGPPQFNYRGDSVVQDAGAIDVRRCRGVVVGCCCCCGSPSAAMR